MTIESSKANTQEPPNTGWRSAGRPQPSGRRGQKANRSECSSDAEQEEWCRDFSTQLLAATDVPHPEEESALFIGIGEGFSVEHTIDN
jgi:hypothetical protein